MSSTSIKPENAAPAATVSPAPAASPTRTLHPGAGFRDGTPIPVAATAPAGPGLLPTTLPVPEQVPALYQPSNAAHLSVAPPTVGSNHAADQNKKARGLVLLQRPNGPSLLTQALATARGIQPLVPADFTHPNNIQPLNKSSYETPSGYPRPGDKESTDPVTCVPHDDTPYESDGGSLTPRGSPRSVAITSSAAGVATATLSDAIHDLPSPGHEIPDFSGLKGYRSLLYRNLDKGNSLERTDKDRELQSLKGTGTFSMGPGGSAAVSRSLDRSQSHNSLDVGEETASDLRPQHKLRTMDHRLSMGPEKIWSIGTGELSNSQDGQVENTVSEVLAGVEPNARSRKASHSLRFFREGLPDDKGRKKESRLGSLHREKVSSAEASPDIVRPGDAQDAQGLGVLPLSSPPREVLSASRISRDRSAPAKSPDSFHLAESPDDYFIIKTSDIPISESEQGARPVDAARPRPQEAHAPPTPPESVISGAEHGQETRRKSGDSTEAGESAEDAEDSGEEKISSAVFLLHQGVEESGDLESLAPGALQRKTTGPRTLSRVEDFHPWLVKADEVETEGPPTELHEPVVNLRHLRDSRLPPEFDGTKPDESAIIDDADTASYLSKPSRPVSQYEDLVHEHQLTPKQPLEAIELIPYKHQVGGHNILWRFSKRAVCKQLNNRENEFYEKVERYHRDLLGFLPRYIGVLNVTFQRQPRRKSTVRKDDALAQERKLIGQAEGTVDLNGNGSISPDEALRSPALYQDGSGHHRVISQSLQSTPVPVPTVTFLDNRHILPRNLLQPAQNSTSLPGLTRSTSASVAESHVNGADTASSSATDPVARPSLEDRHANSWGYTTINKKLRNEVFNDAFLKEPIAIQKHRKAHHRPIPRRTLQRGRRPTFSDPSPMKAQVRVEKSAPAPMAKELHAKERLTPQIPQSQSDLGQQTHYQEREDETNEGDVTGTSAPERDILRDQPSPRRRKRRHSGSALRRKPEDVSETRGGLKYFEEADDAGYKGDNEEGAVPTAQGQPNEMRSEVEFGHSGQMDAFTNSIASTETSGAPNPMELKRIPRPVNPKEAQTQRDSRVEYFLLLEDLTAGMKRPCIMDLKMGTRQYGVDAMPKKQKSQQGKCAKTTSRELGVRVCGLQVWDVRTQSYVFKDKYYGRSLEAGQEFQDALTRFLYDGVDSASILRHIPTVLRKLGQLEVIIRRLRGYRFYAASLLMFYDGDNTPDENHGNGNDTAVDDYSTTDAATDTEEARRTSTNTSGTGARRRRNRHEIDFKMADFANCVTAGDLAKDKPCPPQHPNEPDRGFLRGLRSLRDYFLRIQRDTRAEIGLPVGQLRHGMEDDCFEDEDEDDGEVSE